MSGTNYLINRKLGRTIMNSKVIVEKYPNTCRIIQNGFHYLCSNCDYYFTVCDSGNLCPNCKGILR